MKQDQYAMYLRKSRADAEAEARGEGETLARHRIMLGELAARNGHAIGAVYQEIVSGETIADRPQMQRLLADVASGKWAGVYVAEVERLARGDTMDQGRMAQTFLYSNTKIVTPMRTYDPNDDADLEYFEFSLFMSRREYKTINRRIQAGRMQSLREGKYICSRPAYGYRKVKLQNAKGYTLEIHPEEAAVVRQIFTWYLHGDRGERMGLTRIANRLVDLRVPTGEQGSAWRQPRLYRMLTNEVYIGKIRWGHVKTEKQMAGQQVEKSRRMRKDYQLYDGMHEPIIDEETFYRVQEKLGEANTPLQEGKQLSNPLSGLVFCKECGHAMRGKPAAGRQPAMLFCATYGCKCVRSYRAPIEEAILGALREWLVEYESAPRTTKPAIAPGDDALIDNAIAAVEKELETLRGQKGKLHDLLEQGVYTADVFAERIVSLNSRINSAEMDLQNLQQKRRQNTNRPDDIAPLIPLIRHVLDAYALEITAQQRNDLLRSVLSRVEYHKTVKGNQHVDPNQFSLTIYPKSAGISQ